MQCLFCDFAAVLECGYRLYLHLYVCCGATVDLCASVALCWICNYEMATCLQSACGCVRVTLRWVHNHTRLPMPRARVTETVETENTRECVCGFMVGSNSRLVVFCHGRTADFHTDGFHFLYFTFPWTLSLFLPFSFLHVLRLISPCPFPFLLPKAMLYCTRMVPHLTKCSHCLEFRNCYF